MRFTDRRGRDWTLTWTQYVYLSTASRQQLCRGWGGLSSTLVVRLLEERGLVTVRWSRTPPTWQITSLTAAGCKVLADWRTKHCE